MTVKLEKGVGVSLLNALRAAAFVSQPVWRPVAFKVGDNSNVLETSECVIEDMTTFISNVSQGWFTGGRLEPIVKAECLFEGKLMLSRLLEGSGISCTKDLPILHSRARVPATILFRKYSGAVLSIDNSEFVRNAGYSGFTAINSRHCNINSFTVKKIDETEQQEVFEIVVSTMDGTPGELAVSNALKAVNVNLANIEKYLA